MIKDFIKYRQFLRTQNLSVNEQYMLELLFELHNEQYGYSFPSFKMLLDAFNTSSKNRVSKVLKDLEEKKYIKIEKIKRKNRYKIINIENFILYNTLENKEESNKKIDETLKDKIEIVEKTINKKITCRMKSKLDNIEFKDLKNIDIDLQELEKVNETYYINAIDIYLNNKNKKSSTNMLKKIFKPSFASISGVGMNIDGKDFLEYGAEEFNKMVEIKQKEKYS